MSVTVVNCKRCNRVFQFIWQPFCPECSKIEEDRFSRLYRTLQSSASNGGMSVDALSEETEIDTEDIERYFIEGNLGTAAIYLHIPCQGCGVICTALQRLGRYCLNCSETTANQAGVKVKSMRELNKIHAKTELREKHAEFLRQNQDRRFINNTFGNAFRTRYQ